MSDTQPVADHELEPICEFCGGVIDEPDQECPALHDGRCRP